MIQREWKTATVIHYVNTVDEYGQNRQTVESQKTADIVLHILTQVTNNTPLYEGVQAIALIKTEDAKVGDTIDYAGNKYIVKHILPGKYNQLFLGNE